MIGVLTATASGRPRILPTALVGRVLVPAALVAGAVRMPRTVAVMVQVPLLPAMVPPDVVIGLVFAALVTVGLIPLVHVAVGVPTTVRLAGSVSEKVVNGIAAVPLATGLVITIVAAVVLPCASGLVPKVLVAVSGASAVTLSENCGLVAPSTVVAGVELKFARTSVFV